MHNLPAMAASFSGKVVLVVGASSGIGLAVARLLVRQGALVTITGRRAAALKQARLSLEREVRPNRKEVGVSSFAVDAADYRSMRKVVALIEKQHGGLDLLVQCAGVARPGRVDELPISIYKKQIRANYLTAVHSVRAVLPGMLARGRGQIALIGSTAGAIGLFGYTAYSPAKFAVHGFAEALRMELRPRGISVALVLPPDTDTPGLAAEQRHNPPELEAVAKGAGLLSAQRVAAAILRGLAARKFMIVPGFQNRWIVRINRMLPGLVRFVSDRLVRGARPVSVGRK